MRQVFAAIVLFQLISCKTKQNDTLKITKLPLFKIQLIDSFTIVNSHEITDVCPVVFMYFNTDCIHCQQEIKEIAANIESLKGTRIFLISGDPLENVKAFYRANNLSKYQNITIGKDLDHAFYYCFQPTSVPFLAIYNSKRTLLKVYKQETPVASIINATQAE